MTDLDLLRRYEPILRFTQGEMFFPTPVDEYVRSCSLWIRPPNGPPQMMVPPGKLSLETLARFGEQSPGSALFLRFVEEPLTGLAYGEWLRRRGRPHFQTPGRLARVGLGPRLIDAAFSLSLLVRGSVPGGTAAAAAIQYERICQHSPQPVYYARVLREDGYIILHYLYFYVMNDWRSGFHGANDHEADWEQVFVYLEDDADEPRPAWVACASHNDSGDDRRRRWDDPELTIIDDHPVIYVGAGSHAGYFQPGEYLTRVELTFLQPLLRGARIIERLWRNTLQQGQPSNRLSERVESVISVPFIDYARGDGLAIGPGQATTWAPVLIDDDTGWVHDYRGLWGLDARDPFAGESAPGGPKYDRFGGIRQTWHNPLGWAGLNKVTPSVVLRPKLAEHILQLERELEAADRQIIELRDTLRRNEIELQALQLAGYRRERYEERLNELREKEGELNRLQQQRADLTQVIQSCYHYLEQEELGRHIPPQAHIRHKYRPETPQERRRNIVAEVWASISVGLLMISMVGLIVLGLGGWIVAIALPAGAFVLIEAALHRRLHNLLVNATMTLAVISAAILLYEFFRAVILVTIVVVAIIVVRDNIRELREY